MGRTVQKKEKRRLVIEYGLEYASIIVMRQTTHFLLPSSFNTIPFIETAFKLGELSKFLQNLLRAVQTVAKSEKKKRFIHLRLRVTQCIHFGRRGERAASLNTSI